MGWLSIGLKLVPLILGAVQAIEAFVTSAKGRPKEDAAVAALHQVLQVVEAGAGRDLLNDADINEATRHVMRALVALENLIARKSANAQSPPSALRRDTMPDGDSCT